MKRSMFAGLPCQAVVLGIVLSAGVPASAHEHAVETADPAHAAATLGGRADLPPGCSYGWIGHEEAIEEFLRTAPIERFEDIPVGITRPKRAFFVPGGWARSMAWKPLPTAVIRGYHESYRSEIAAYRLNRLLGMDMVPPTVERRVGRLTGAAIMWIDGVRPWDVHTRPTAPGAAWSYQVSRMKLFDQLIGNIDRNRGNLLHDEDGHLFLIDHSRAFVRNRTLNGLDGPSQVDRQLWERMDALTREELLRELTPWLTRFQIDAMLARRDRMRADIAEKVRVRGEQIAFLP
jgi:hypothetical protein